MSRLLKLLILCLFSFAAQAQQKIPERPKLVVGLVVDQMRWDYLYRYYDRFGSGGFRRLMNEGFNCEQTYINYVPAYTAPGHACVYTGSVPAIHGIAGNNWIDNRTGKNWYCTEDTTVLPLGGSLRAGQMSPRNLLSSTVTDELRLATNFRSRVYGIALKDRGAILPAGHLGNGAFWFDDSTGSFISSNYYGKALPDWLNRFNARHLPDSFLAKDWNLLYPAATYTQSLPDDNPYEGLSRNEKKPVFPHKAQSPLRFSRLRSIPAGNTYTLRAARACLEGEGLGNRGFTDFLCISLSSTDYIGHQYGPNSMEVEDTYLRLDRDLERFLNYLDRRYGKDNYLFFLTADHGGAHNPEYLKDIRLPAGNVSEPAMAKDLAAFLKKEFRQEGLIRGIENYQVVLNEERITAAKLDRQLVKKAIRGWLEAQPGVAWVVDLQDLDAHPVPEPIRTMAINGYHRLRSGSMLIIFDPGWFFGYARTGTTHSTWHPYDTHIPMLWYGWQIRTGKTNRRVHMEDIAPTLAAMLHIQPPNGCMGQVIREMAR